MNKDKNILGGRSRQRSDSDSDSGYRHSPDIKLNQKPKTQQAGGRCEYCGSLYSATAEICPECGMSVGRNKCTFCGSEMPSGVDRCPSCGASREGEECPNCGTINFRNFCRSCNQPITRRGEEALAKFRRQPQFQAAEKINEKLGQIADFIDGKVKELPQDILRMAEEMKESSKAEPSTEMATPADDKSTKKPQGRRVLMPDFKNRMAKSEEESKPKASEPRPMTIEEAMKLYEQKKAEMDALLDSIMPDSDAPPEAQRDFYSARMVVVTRKHKKIVEEPVAWICNFCGYRHNKPQECAEPWHGGTWVHETREVTYETETLEKMK